MPSDETTRCDQCGAETHDPQWCDNCGAPLEQTPAAPAAVPGDAPEAAASAQPAWLAQGETITVSCDLASLGEARFSGQAMLEFEVDRIAEASSVRHIFAATCKTIVECAQELDQADLLSHLQQHAFSIEELGALLWSPEDRLPDALRPLVRLPLGERPRGTRQVRVFPEDGSKGLEEFILGRKNFLDLDEIKEVFGALLDMTEQLHTQGYLYLRLSPWTLRLKLGQHPPRPAQDSGIGEEETFSEVLPKRSKADNVDTKAAPKDEKLAEGATEADSDLETQGLSTLQGPPAAEGPNAPGATRVERALLDGGFRFYVPHIEYEEVPVVVGFSPPEMFGRMSAEISVACDIFSLGMLLYFLISGELPPTSVYTRYMPALPARHFRPDFPLGFHGVIARATRPSPKERFESVGEMREAFERALKVCDERSKQVQSSYVPKIDFAVERHIGIHKRLRNPTNQDQVFGAMSEDRQFGVIVVADGVSMASYGSGDRASKHVVDVAQKHWPRLLEAYTLGEKVDEFDTIYSILGEANLNLIDAVNADYFPFEGSPHEVMGTTTLVAVIQKGMVTLGSLGDSRGYLQRGSTFEQITIDHNLWTLSILDGIPADNAMALPHGDALARCLGTFFIEDKRLMPIPPQPDIFRFPVTSGDTLLLTTDGLTDFAGANPLASEDNILSVLLSESNTPLACLELVLLANRGGGGDNVGVGLVRFQ